MTWWQVALTAFLTALATLGSAVLVYKQTVRSKQIEAQGLASKAQIDNVIDERARLYGRVQFLEERYEKLLMQVGVMNAQIAALQEEKDQLGDELHKYKEVHDENARLKAEKEQLRQEVIAVHKRNTELTTELSTYRARVNVLAAENTTLRGLAPP